MASRCGGRSLCLTLTNFEETREKDLADLGESVGRESGQHGCGSRRDSVGEDGNRPHLHRDQPHDYGRNLEALERLGLIALVVKASG